MERLAWSWSFWIAAALAAFAISAVSTWLAIGYARKRRLIDEPGVRRSHSTPTPRGGGIGIVIAVVVAACIPAMMRPPTSIGAAVMLTVAIVIVASVGWIDDHRGLSARARFAAHCVAAVLFLLPVIAAVALSPDAVEEQFATSVSTVWISLVVIVLAIVWFVNLHNFMDGIDGILAAQAIFVLAALALVCRHVGEPHAGEILVFAGAAAGFLPFNFPRARIFMGDVGSGAIGYAVAGIGALAATGLDAWHAPLLLIPLAAFMVDSSLTLLRRVRRGERWWTPHTQHAYQVWARRAGHVRVTLAYAIFTLLSLVSLHLVTEVRIGFILCMGGGWYISAAFFWWLIQRTERSAA